MILVKKLKFLHVLCLSKIDREKVFADVLDKKEAFKVARYSFPGPTPPKFEHKVRRHKQSFEKIATTVVLDKDENLL